MKFADNPILTTEQKSLLHSFSGSDLRLSFYLTGGTALSAFYLSHRLSEDLDFFSEKILIVSFIAHDAGKEKPECFPFMGLGASLKNGNIETLRYGI